MKKTSMLLVLVFTAFISFSFTKKTKVTKKKSSVAAVSKTLAFPVAGKRSNIGSFWGAVREGGKRKHEGIDIFAKKGTPVVAISDGIIVARGTTPKGGKVLWLKSSRHPWSAYYAHLDKQLVKNGQYVRKGQVIGTVGKTGNARTTPPHLHFGIYSTKGPVNPLPYVKHSPKVAAPKAVAKTKSTVVKKRTTTKKSVRA